MKFLCYNWLTIALFPLVFTDVLNTNCPQEINGITVGLILVVNKFPIESRCSTLKQTIVLND